MTAPAFTILLPVHRPPALLPYAINSVLAQSRQDFELFVICDGAPPETAACAQEFAARDRRIRVFVHPKGERNGEIYRDQALREAHGEFVCQIGDDDLWLPNHLAEMAALLRDVDFGNLPQIVARIDGTIRIVRGGLGERRHRERMLREVFNIFGQTVAGYRLSTYRQLPVGWSPAPPGIPPDVFMWRKFLTHEGIRVGTRMGVTSLKFAAAHRRDWTMEQRRVEIAGWAERLSTPAGRDDYTQHVLASVNHDIYRFSLQNARLKHRLGRAIAEADAMRNSLSWRLTAPVRALARLIRGKARR